MAYTVYNTKMYIGLMTFLRGVICKYCKWLCLIFNKKVKKDGRGILNEVIV